jgi:hypothetical protein
MGNGHRHLHAEGRCEEMIRISVRVGGGAGCFTLTIEAESIEQALKIAAGQNPGEACEVTFPIDPERFFVEESVVPARRLAA